MRRSISASPRSPCKRGAAALAFLALASFLAGTTRAASAPDPAMAVTPHAEARLMSEHDALAPGAENWVGLQLKLIPGWHTYWRNPGDSGIPVSIQWDLPPGLGAGEILWPVPARFPTPPLMNYGYEKEVLLPVRITVPASLHPREPVVLRARADWLVCDDICVPERADLRLTMAIAANPGGGDQETTAAFDAARASLPRPFDGEAKASLGADSLRLELKGGAFAEAASPPEIFPVSDGLVKNAAAPVYARIPGGWAVTLAKDDNFPAGPKRLRVVAAIGDAGNPGSRIAYELEAELRAGGGPAERPAGWLARILLFAFLGGVILNLMPCVFPVIGIKILNFVKHGRHSRRETLVHAATYAGGVVASFLAMAALLVAFRSAGEQLGWGFQLQSPAFLFVLASILFVMGLNLMGFFEWSGRFTGIGDEWTRGTGRAASFFTGALAVVVATPCTAPFMGTAVGVAFTQPPLIMMLIFLFLGLGMAAPYVVLSASPPLLGLLPKPGHWMSTFKELLAFPLFGTCAWLLWVLDLQAGPGAMAAALAGLLTFTFGIWLQDRMRPGAARILVLLAFIALGYYLGCGAAHELAAPPAAAGAGAAAAGAGAAPAAAGEPAWRKFSPEALARARASGKPVFVNFTAAWCITCNVNERLVFRKSTVLSALAAKEVVLLKGDWTNRDAAIARALAEHGRAGVPLYLLYRPGADRPEILPQILTPGAFLEALGR